MLDISMTFIINLFIALSVTTGLTMAATWPGR